MTSKGKGGILSIPSFMPVCVLKVCSATILFRLKRIIWTCSRYYIGRPNLLEDLYRLCMSSQCTIS